MKIWKNVFTACVAVTVSSLFLVSCHKSKGNGGKETPDVEKEAKEYVHSLMKEIYYWNTGVPATVNSNLSIFDYFDAMLVSKDRWSWMADAKTFNSMESGVQTSFGFHIVQPYTYYQDYSLYISYVDEESPLAKNGVKRGWKLSKINGTDVQSLIKNNTLNNYLSSGSNTYTFIKPDKSSVDLPLTSSTFQTKSVLMENVFTSADMSELPTGAKVGYINYLTFNKGMGSQIRNALKSMKDQNVTDLIIDLRYNGGGDLDICEDMINLIAPASADHKEMLTLSHNSRYSSQNTTSNIERNGNSFNLNRLFVIGTKSTASASEALVNCLRPYMPVYLVGETTYGKPNGMYVFTYPEKTDNYSYAFLPICFYCLNSEGKADYDNGLTPDNVRYDDVYTDWGAGEDLIKACLTYIATGSFPALPAVSASAATASSAQAGGQLFKGPSDAPGYGLGYKKNNKLPFGM